MSDEQLDLTLKIWRQPSKDAKGEFKNYKLKDVSTHMSFLEMLDVLNEQLIQVGEEPIAFDHDCREGICGTCGVMINGQAHGPDQGITTCQLHMRRFRNGQTITIEPWRAKPFPVLKDLMVERTPFDNIMSAGGYVSVNVGNAPDANAIPVPRHTAEKAMDAAACIGCGACVAACKNASAMLFVSAKVSQMALLPQGKAEKQERVMRMVTQMDEESFGACTNTYECEAACPKEISVTNIARLNREYFKATVASDVE
ncbi:Fumarate reductase iron-sulfur subunit [Polystyrenella longa]|uniref:Succinate dehydrogenase iron-sulfur subunit n=1 Tax=Polystyrenella longa TaxID=2528007 RepID=A0A518CL49_9PLAN|nr:succinate dehydrogenase/fumarate reductase iron-sulfur subunit [Polystyrenella longa]QDU79953.1 Fumarate reductase iron-sulfur subunit [Polystyrenella longa]